MRRCDKTEIVYDYFGVKKQDIIDAYRYVGKWSFLCGVFGYFDTFIRDLTEEDKGFTHYQAVYIGRPFIEGRRLFEVASKAASRFLKATGKMEHDMTRDESNIFE